MAKPIKKEFPVAGGDLTGHCPECKDLIATAAFRQKDQLEGAFGALVQKLQRLFLCKVCGRRFWMAVPEVPTNAPDVEASQGVPHA
jgi:hypothetical protein